jgi:FMN phosphatase YigB (HAD superfamily)
MSKIEITHIVFDLGNVVLTNDWHYESPKKFEEYQSYFDISSDDMERGWDAFWPQFSLGRITEEEFWTGFLQTAGVKNIDVEYAKKLWRKYQTPIEGMLVLLEKLKKHYTLAALTTISKEWLDYK